MQKLILELKRLYLPAAAPPTAVLEQHLLGQSSGGISLLTADGTTRAMVLAFPKLPGGPQERHWTSLCNVANAMQAELGLPAPAVSISGSDGYCLWLSLDTPAPIALANQFLDLLRTAYMLGGDPAPSAPAERAELPPCLHPASGKWAAFIHPGLGASFAEETGLDMAPPCAGQIALLEGLHSISQAQFEHAMQTLRLQVASELAGSKLAGRNAIPAGPALDQGLLLKDASLEDIVRHLHSKNIEPTFRHIIGH